MARAAENYESKYVKKDYKKKSKELNLLQAEAAHQKFKYENLNKAFTKRKTYKEETINLADSSESNYSSSGEPKTPPPRTGKNKTSITYDSDSADVGKISSSSTSSGDRNLINGCREAFIIDKATTNSKSKLK